MAAAVRYARERGVPYFGICLGLQCATIEFARNVLHLEGATSTELDQEAVYPVIHLISDQHDVTQKGGTMRLGAYPCSIRQNTRASTAYSQDHVSERHRHRYEFNNAYREQFERAGLIVSGVYGEKDLVEIIELKGHPWFVAVQFHPEFKSKPRKNFLRQGSIMFFFS